MSNHSPEIITISDSEEEEVSFDLFNSTSEEDLKSIDDHPDSDDNDVFSTTDSENLDEKDNSDSRSDDKIRHSRADYNDGTQRSFSVISSVHKNHITKPIRESNVKSDPWTSKHMNKIAKKLEERRRIMKELTKNDGKMEEKNRIVVPDNDLDLSEKKGKEMLISGTTTRKKADRAKLQGVACAASKAYFDALELSPESKERRINEVSRVRVVAQRMPSTPENYWEVGFPSESEQRRRGLIKEVHVRNKNGRNLFH